MSCKPSRLPNPLPLAAALVVLLLGVAWGQKPTENLAATRISVPSGPGSVEGLGESFEPQWNSGTYRLSLPLKLPPMRGRANPVLSVGYDSGNGNGPMGMGWKLDVPFIQRQTDKGLPHYEEGDRMIDWMGEELLAAADGTYRARNESAFLRWEQAGAGWVATRPDGTRMVFGQSEASRLERPSAQGGGTFRWMLESVEDTNGNRAEYRYLKEYGQIYLSEVEWGLHSSGGGTGTFRLVFGYKAGRGDVLSDYRGRFMSLTRLRLEEITLFQGSRRIRHWGFQYDPTRSNSLLIAIKQSGDERTSLGSGAALNKDFLPPMTMEYSSAEIPTQPTVQTVSGLEGNLDFAGRQNNRTAEIVDLDGDGLPDVIFNDDGMLYSQRNLGTGTSFSAPQAMQATETMPQFKDGVRVTDIRGDLRPKILVPDMATGVRQMRLHEILSLAEVGPSLPFAGSESNGFISPTVQVVDINNDRAMDLFQATAGAFEFLMSNPEASPTEESASYGRGPDSALAEALESNPNWQMLDMNGDRMPDIVVLDTRFDSDSVSGILVYHGLGLGEFEGPHFMIGGPRDSDLGPRMLAAFSLVDLDMDGFTDLVQIESGFVRVWRNLDGVRWAEEPELIWANIPELDGQTGTVRFLDMNGNGSVDIVWSDSATSAVKFIDLFPDTKPNLLLAFSNGIGKRTEISYRPSTEFMLASEEAGTPWETKPPFPVPVVAEIRESDGRGNTYLTRASYRDGYYDAAQRQFRGFRRTVVTEVGDASTGAPSLVTEYEFDTGAEVEALKGRPLHIVAREASGEIYYEVQNEWRARSLSVPLVPAELDSVIFVEQLSETKTHLEKGVGQPVSTKREMSYDDFGNVITQRDHGRLDSGWDDEKLVTSSFTASSASGQQKWILNLPVTRTIADSSGNPFAKSTTEYDGLGIGQVAKGNPTSVKRYIEPGAGNDSITTDVTTYDEFGNPIAVRDGKGNLTEFEYSESLRTHPTRESIHTGRSILAFEAQYDSGLGVLTSLTDPNGAESSFAYDPFGRLVAIIKPGDSASAPTNEYEYVLGANDGSGLIINSVFSRQRTSPGGGTIDSVSYADGLGRILQVRSQGETGAQAVVTEAKTFNARRGVRSQFLPFFGSGLAYSSPGNQPAAVMEYDALGRVIRTTQPDGSFATTTHEPLAQTVQDEEQASGGFAGNSKRFVYDGLSDNNGNPRLRIVEERIDGQTLETRYDYDLLNNWTGYVDAKGNTKKVLHDGLGRQIAMLDPDRGPFWWAHDEANNVIRTRDAKGQEMVFAYDGANRLIGEWYLEANQGGGVSPLSRMSGGSTPGRKADVTYHYDQPLGPTLPGGIFSPSDSLQNIMDHILGRSSDAPGPHLDLNGDGTVDVRDLVLYLKNGGSVPGGGVPAATFTQGRIAWIEDLSGQEHLSYDARGRVLWKVKRINRPNNVGEPLAFMIGNQYDSADRVTELRYPDGSKLEIGYNARGLASSVSGVISSVSYNPAGDIASIALACGVSTSAEFDSRLRPISRISTRTADGAALLSYTYEYDRVSNIRSIGDARSTGVLEKIASEIGIAGIPAAGLSEAQTFIYDGLYRMTSASGAGIGGTLSYAYDSIGNLTSQTSTVQTPAGQKLHLGSVTSGGSVGTSGRSDGTAPGPHALTATESEITLEYDANGNVVALDDAKYFWNTLDRMTTLETPEGRATYVYDYSGKRVRRDVNSDSFSTTVFYPDPACEFRDGKFLKYAHFGPHRVARADQAAEGAFHPDRFYLHDHLGSTRLVLLPNAQVAEARSEFPYGSPRFHHVAQETTPEHYSFSGKEQDAESGLHYFETRYLASHLGMFSRTDELTLVQMDSWKATPKKWHPYSYTWGNPITMVDPDGRDAKSPQQQVLHAGMKTAAMGALGIAVVAFAPVALPVTAVGIAYASGAVAITAGVAQMSLSSNIKTPEQAKRTNDNFSLGQDVATGALGASGFIKSHLKVASVATEKSHPEISEKLSQAADWTSAISEALSSNAAEGTVLERFENAVNVHDSMNDVFSPLEQCHGPAGCAPTGLMNLLH
jgi:RHS repeat-associated protein